MVVDNYPNWLRLLRQIGKPLALVMFLSFLTTGLNYVDHPFKQIAVPDVTMSLLGAALGILLGFRTNSAYARWWEARTLWGGLVNSSRSLARQAISFAPQPSHPMAVALVHHQIAFVHALRCMLRKQEPWADIDPMLPEATRSGLRTAKNVPAALLMRMGEIAAEAANTGVLNEWRLQQIDRTLTDLSNIQGGCERIKNTPLPRQYDFYPELFVKAYCIILPMVLVDEMKIWTPLGTLVISFVFLVLNRIGKNLEDPFENSVYDTPMTALSRTIETNLRQALHETQLPAPLALQDGVLM